MNKYIISSLMLLALWQATFSQSKHGVAWVNGSVDTRVTRFQSNSTIRQYYLNLLPPNRSFIHGHSNICDSSGKLILISDGINLFDSSLNFIDGGSTLSYPKFYQGNGGSGVVIDQWSIFLPFENNNYQFINVGVSDESYDSVSTANPIPATHLLKHTIDMKLNNGAGKVVDKMTILDTGRFEASGMMACRHGNGKDWWLIKLGADSVYFYTYLLTKDSVFKMPETHFPNLVKEWSPLWLHIHTKGQLMFNNSGTKMALVTKSRSSLYTFDFDRCTGEISQAKNHRPPLGGLDSNMKGVCFSPSNRFIYVAQSSRILQFDTQGTDSASSWYIVAGMDTILTQFQGYENMYQGPDYKIYIGFEDGFSNAMSVINQPNVKGVGCAWCPRCLRFDTLAPPPYTGKGVSQPPCMPNYSLGALANPCPPLGIESVTIQAEGWVVYPNPASTILQIKNAPPKSAKQLYNAIGQLMLSTNANEIDVSHLPKGIYYLKVAGVCKKVLVE